MVNRHIEKEQQTAVNAIAGRTDLSSEKKETLLQAMFGDGTFRDNVIANEKKCRITGVEEEFYLFAGHIKPWHICSDEEKLDGLNGLLLAPHIDHLFRTGMISFSGSGELLVSPQLPVGIIKSWGLADSLFVGSFLDEQQVYLDYHRTHIFRN